MNNKATPRSQLATGFECPVNHTGSPWDEHQEANKGNKKDTYLLKGSVKC